MAASDLMGVVLVLVPMLLSLTVHEFSHALAARQLGDRTAELAGRLTLNPIAHIDPVGTLILPVLLLLWGGGFLFGWAKPVPVSAVQFTRKLNMRTGMLIVAAAGPVSNLILATLCTGIAAGLYESGFLHESPVVQGFLAKMITINVALAIFNSIPIGPLDGMKMLTGLLPHQAAVKFEHFNYQYGSWLMLAVIVFGSNLIRGPFFFVLIGLLNLFGVPPAVLFA